MSAISLPDLGINSDSIRYEVALETLGQRMQPYIMALEAEKSAASPSQALIAFCQAHIEAVQNLQEELQKADKATIERILNPADDIFGI